MHIYLVRHAHAVPEEFDIRDEDRYLSASGRQTARRVGHAMKAEGVEVDAVIASPLVRAVQTAELIADALDFIQPVEATSMLRPGAHPRVAGDALGARNQSVLVVGHAPGISSLGAYLVGRPGFPEMRTAQVCALNRGAPLWTMHPDTLNVSPLYLA